MTMLVFESDRFRPYLPDDRQVNPNVLGFELAAWLSRELAARGWITSYPGQEDWGWYLDGDDQGSPYMICCSGSEEDGGGYEWRVYVTQPKKLFGPRPDGALSALILSRVKQVLDESGIHSEPEED